MPADAATDWRRLGEVAQAVFDRLPIPHDREQTPQGQPTPSPPEEENP